MNEITAVKAVLFTIKPFVMKKVFPFLLILAIGIGIAVTVKANKKFVNCCDDFGKVCEVINGITLLGPKNTICP